MPAAIDAAVAPRQWVINDTRGLEYRLTADCDDAVAFAATLRDHHGRVAGHLAWRCHPVDAIQLEALLIENRAIRLTTKEKVRRVLRHQPRTATFRGVGLGSVLLQIALAEARAAKVARVYGYLCQDHLHETPDLARWLWHRGFVVADPPAGAPPGTLHWVYMDLNET